MEKVGIFLKSRVVYCIVSIVWKNHEDRTTISIKFPTPRQDTLSAPTDDIVAPRFVQGGCLFVKLRMVFTEFYEKINGPFPKYMHIAEINHA